MAQSELDKLLKAFEEKNTSMEYYILMSSEGIPFKSNIENNAQVVKLAGLIFDLILYSKRTLEDLKKVNEPGVNKNLTLRMRLKNGEELIIVQQNEFYLISKQICKIVDAPTEPEKKAE
jgi:hypothetical protein